MNIQQFVIHRIEKQAQTPPSVFLGSALLPTGDSRVQQFARQVASVFQESEERPSCVFAPFHEDTENYPFSNHCREFFDDGQDLLTVSGRATQRLAHCMSSKPTSTGGYVTFIGYQQDDGARHLLVVMLHKQDGFSVDDQSLALMDVSHLDMRQVDKAAIVNGGVPGGVMPDRPLTYAGFRKPLSQYFQEFLGPDRYRNPNQDSHRFVQTVDQFCKQENFSSAQRDEARVAVREYIMERAAVNEDVDLNVASAFIHPAEPKKFMVFAEKKKVSAFFRPDPKVFTRWRLIRHQSADGVLVQFGEEQIDRRVILNPAERTLLIREVEPELFEKVRSGDRA